MIQRFLLLGGTAMLATTLAISSAAAANRAIQSPTQSQNFLPWQGCWQADGAPGDELLCILTDRSGGMRMITVQNGEVVAESRIIADGRSRPVEQDECKGTEQARWSTDRQRLFLSSNLTCAQNVARNANGLFVFTSPREWLSVQSVTVGDQTAVRTTLYTAVEPVGVPAMIRNALSNSSSARMAAIESVLQTVDENDVNEAVRYLDAAVVQEWIEVTELPFAIAGADELQSSTQAPYTSALDQVGRMSNPEPRVVREVHVVERPTEVVHHTYVTHVVRSCWDPFWGGYCGHRHYSWYSPWGYDPFRWRVVWAPLVIVRNTPVIIRRSPRDHYHRGPIVRRDRDDDWRGGRATRDGYRSGDRNRDSNDRNQYQNRDRNVARGITVHSDPVRASSSIDRPRTVSPSGSVDRTRTVSRGNDSDRGRAVPRGYSVERSSGGSINRSTSSSSNRGSVTRSSSSSSRSSERATSSAPRRATARSSR